MCQQPEQTPWGEVQHCEVLCPGAFMVSTAIHGGTMITKDMAALSPAARKCGFRQGGYLCFEEDGQESVALRKLLDKKLWAVPDLIKDRAAFEENINKSVREYNLDYWRARQAGLEKAAPMQEQPPSQNVER